jgi:hypothetical protein
MILFFKRIDMSLILNSIVKHKFPKKKQIKAKFPLRGASVSLFDQSYHISMAKRKSFPITKN